MPGKKGNSRLEHEAKEADSKRDDPEAGKFTEPSPGKSRRKRRQTGPTGFDINLDASISLILLLLVFSIVHEHSTNLVCIRTACGIEHPLIEATRVFLFFCHLIQHKIYNILHFL